MGSALQKPMQAVRMHVDANNMLKVISTFVFKYFQFLAVETVIWTSDKPERNYIIS